MPCIRQPDLHLLYWSSSTCVLGIKFSYIHLASAFPYSQWYANESTEWDRSYRVAVLCHQFTTFGLHPRRWRKILPNLCQMPNFIVLSDMSPVHLKLWISARLWSQKTGLYPFPATSDIFCMQHGPAIIFAYSIFGNVLTRSPLHLVNCILHAREAQRIARISSSPLPERDFFVTFSPLQFQSPFRQVLVIHATWSYRLRAAYYHNHVLKLNAAPLRKMHQRLRPLYRLDQRKKARPWSLLHD